MSAEPDVRIEQLIEARLLARVDGHVADTVCRLTGDGDADVRLAVALAVQAVRNSHVCLDLERTTTHGVVASDAPGANVIDVALPSLESWRSRLVASPAVRVPAAAEAAPVPTGTLDDSPATPLVLDGNRLYLDRYWRYEQRVADRLRQLASEVSNPPRGVEELLAVLFGDGVSTSGQQAACRAGASHRLTVLTGGPGTGKTTTILRLMAVLASVADDAARMVLTAPTGKAAARLAETVRADVDQLPLADTIVEQLRATPATTLHRLLGWQPQSPSRFRHDRSRPLAHDVVIVDEASMVSLPLMAKLLDALGDDTRLVLVGDREQLASIDAGAVFADVCGPRSTSVSGERSRTPASAAGQTTDRRPQVVELTHNFRFDANSGLVDVAAAVRDGDIERVVALAAPHAPPDRGHPLPEPVWARVTERYAHAVRLARQGAPPTEVLKTFERVRVLAALRRGPHGVEAINQAIAEWLASDLGDDTIDTSRVPGRFAGVGTPLLVTRNDHRLELYNGDVGVVVPDPSGTAQPVVAFAAAGGQVRLIPPARLPASEPVYALSVHKSQGSQYDEVVLVLPPTDTALLTRELVYTGVTRARSRLTLVADTQVLAAALGRRVQRASGLRQRLWGQPGDD